MSFNFGKCPICKEYSMYIDRHTCDPIFEVTTIENFGYSDEDRGWEEIRAKDAKRAAEKYAEATYEGGYGDFLEFYVVAVRARGTTDEPQFFSVEGYLDPTYEAGDPIDLEKAKAAYKEHYTYEPY
jgi:hypothetical protein